MKVKRIVSNIAAQDPEKADAFYREIFELDLLTDIGWFRMYGNSSETTVQLNIATEGGAGTEVADISIEVDDLDVAIERVKRANVDIEYGPITEPWGLRRFYVRDPFGKLINVLQYQ